MSEKQKEMLSIVSVLSNNDIILAMKPLFVKILDETLLKIDSSANLEEMDEYDKIAVLRATQVLEDGEETIPYEEVLEELGLN